MPLCRSPVYATFTEALDGAASIRAYEAQHRFCQLNEQQVAIAQQAAFAGLMALSRPMTLSLVHDHST